MEWRRGENRSWHCRLRAGQGNQRWILAAGLENSVPLPLELLGHIRGTQRWAQPMRADTESGASHLARWDSRLRVLHAPPSAGPHGGGSWERSLILPVAGWTCKAPCVHLGNKKAWGFFELSILYWGACKVPSVVSDSL